MPFEIFTGYAGIVLKTVNDARNTAGQGNLGIRDTVTHGITGPDPHRNSRFFGKLHQLIDKGHNKAIEVCSGNVFKMTARHYTGFKRILTVARYISIASLRVFFSFLKIW